MLYNELHQGGTRALLDWDNTLFDNLVLPDDLNTDEVKQMVVDDIIFRHGDQPLFVPDPTVMKYYIGAWSARMVPLWQRYYNVCIAEYDPIENYNRIEDTTVDLTHGHSITTDDDLTHGHTVTTDDDLTGGITVEQQVSALNENTYQPESKTLNGGKDQRDISEKHTGKDQRDVTETHSGTDSNTIDGHVHGNIGVTTSQQMLESEIALIPKLDIIKYISDCYQAEFCLAVY